MPRPSSLFATSLRPAAVLAAAITFSACEAPTTAIRAELRHADASSSRSVGAAAFTYELLVDGTDLHASATATEVLGPPGTGIVGAPGADRSGRAAGQWIPGQHRDEVYVLRDVRASDRQLLDWYAAATRNPGAARATAIITVRNSLGHVIATLDLRGVLPAKVQGPVLNGDSNDVAIEELELVAGGIKLPCSNSDIPCP